jgi:hydrogenase maturation protease
MKTLVLGIGNPILSDDGVGNQVARVLQNQLKQPDVTIIETSVAGLDILDLLAGYDRLIVVDAIQTRAGKAGDVYRLEPDPLIATRHAATPHDVNFATALELGKRLGMALPKKITIFGIEAADVTSFSEECTPQVQGAISICVEMIIREISSNGSEDS